MSAKHCNDIKQGLTSNPKKFLAANVILVPDPGANLSLSPIRSFDFDYYDTGAGGFYSGIAGSGSLTAYYLPWDANTGYHIIVETDKGADIMFTAQLSGCAVGYIRASDKSGAVRVSHHNIQDAQGTTDHTAMQESLSFAQAAVHRNDYRLTSSHLAYVFGVIDKGFFGSKTWRFYVQKVVQRGLGDYEVLGVNEL